MRSDYSRPLRVGIVAAAAAFALFLSGCGGAAQTSPTAAGTSSGPAAVTKGGNLEVALMSGPASLDPAFGNAPDLDRNVFNLFYEGLIRMAPGGEIQPGLAESYDTSADGLTLTFHLREGITFSDGEAFNADAVVANLDRVRDPEVASPRANDLSAVAAVRAVDALTVEVTLANPSPLSLAGLAGEAGMMVSPKALGNPETLKANPVGTGPFLFDGYVNSQDISAKKNPGYWGKDADGNQLPYLDSVVMHVVPDQNVKLTSLKTGQYQLIDSIPVRQVESVASDPALQIIEGRGVEKWMAFNTSRPPFDNVKLRQAVAFAINREAIAQTIAGDRAEVNATLCTPSEVCFDSNLSPTATDVEKAKSLLQEAGVSTLSITLKVINREPDNTIAQIVQAQLKEVGITVEVQVLERESWIKQVLDGDFDLATLQIGVPRLDPALAFNGSFAEGASQNWARVDDPELFDAIATSVSTYDAAERKAAYAKAQKILLDKAYYAFFYWNNDPAGASAKLQGAGGDQAGSWVLSQAWLNA